MLLMTIVGNHCSRMMTIVCRTLVVSNRMMVPYGERRGTSAESCQPWDGFWPRFKGCAKEPFLVAGWSRREKRVSPDIYRATWTRWKESFFANALQSGINVGSGSLRDRQAGRAVGWEEI